MSVVLTSVFRRSLFPSLYDGTSTIGVNYSMACKGIRRQAKERFFSASTDGSRIRRKLEYLCLYKPWYRVLYLPPLWRRQSNTCVEQKRPGKKKTKKKKERKREKKKRKKTGHIKSKFAFVKINKAKCPPERFCDLCLWVIRFVLYRQTRGLQ